jgi:hypothetical protein
MAEMETVTETEKTISVDPYIKKTHYGTYLVTSHSVKKVTKLIGDQVCDHCKKNAPDERFTLGDYSEAYDRKFFCSKHCLLEHLNEKV